MTLTQILIFGAAALLYSFLIPGRLRGWVLMVGSVFAVYWLQPVLAIRYLDFALPTLTLGMTVGVWVMVRREPWRREDGLALGLTVAVVVAISLTRYLIPELRPTPSRPPGIALVLMGLAGTAAVVMALEVVGRRRRVRLWAGLAVIIAAFVVLKTDSLTVDLAEQLRQLADQSVDLADPSDLQWLGFSYVTFRLIHMIRDRQTDRLPAVGLREHLTYVIFFPAFTAGPIDRSERFQKDWQALPDLQTRTPLHVVEGSTRIAVGVFKKFVVADTLALVALNATNAEQVTGMGATWVLLYLYAFRLFFDFSGYSDIAIGLGYLFGIRLPENFDRPYLKPNITEFWQSWHMTLSNWVRFYVFFPLSRAMLRMKRRPRSEVVVLIAHLSTMIIIGLWHGITVNFFIWGVWHGVGLFVHKMWTDRTRKFYRKLKERPRLETAWRTVGTVWTFHYVAVGWVWFSLPTSGQAWDVFLQLWGVG